MAERAPVGAHIPRPPGALSGSPAPWSGLPEAQRGDITVDEVGRSLERRGDVQPRARSLVERVVTPAELPSSGDSRPAAVMCLLFESGGEANVVLTRRSAHLRSHGGEVSFPGGRLQAGELPLQAALREAKEEIGVDPAIIEVIGQLTPLTTVRSPALVHCFVARLPAGPRWGRVELRLGPEGGRKGLLGAAGPPRCPRRVPRGVVANTGAGRLALVSGSSVFSLGGRRCMGCHWSPAY